MILPFIERSYTFIFNNDTVSVVSNNMYELRINNKPVRARVNHPDKIM